MSYPNADLPYSQFIGALNGSIGGSHTDWSLESGSVWTNRGHAHAFGSSATNIFRATASKEFTNGPGGMVFYLGGHSYDTTPLPELNGIRMFLNAVFVPATRPTNCGFTFFCQPACGQERIDERVGGRELQLHDHRDKFRAFTGRFTGRHG